MLSKTDLSAIGKVFDQKFDQKLDQKLSKGLAPIQKDIKTIKTDIKKLRKDLNGTIKFFDDRNVKIEKKLSEFA